MVHIDEQKVFCHFISFTPGDNTVVHSQIIPLIRLQGLLPLVISEQRSLENVELHTNNLLKL